MAGGGSTRRGSSYQLAASGQAAVVGRAMDRADVDFFKAVLIGALVIVVLGVIGGLS